MTEQMHARIIRRTRQGLQKILKNDIVECLKKIRMYEDGLSIYDLYIEKESKNLITAECSPITYQSFDVRRFSPRIDLVILPFDRLVDLDTKKEETYDCLIRDNKMKSFIEQLWVFSDNRQNQHRFCPVFDNKHAPAFGVFEIEHSKDKKHIIGSMTIAALYGYFGVLVYKDDFEENLKGMFYDLVFKHQQPMHPKVKNYKITQNIFSNLFIIKESNFEACIKKLSK